MSVGFRVVEDVSGPWGLRAACASGVTKEPFGVQGLGGQVGYGLEPGRSESVLSP